MHQAKGTRGAGPIVSKGAHWLLIWGPILLLGGPGWRMGLNCGPLTLQKSSVGCRRPRMYTKKIRYCDSALARKRPSGGPAELFGCIGTHCTPLATSLTSFHSRITLTKHGDSPWGYPCPTPAPKGLWLHSIESKTHSCAKPTAGSFQTSWQKIKMSHCFTTSFYNVLLLLSRRNRYLYKRT